MWVYNVTSVLITDLSNSKSQIREKGLENSAIPQKNPSVNHLEV